MNKGLYHSPGGYLIFLKTWKNSTKNSGVTLSLHYPDHVYENFSWTNVDTDEPDFNLFIGSTCLVQW